MRLIDADALKEEFARNEDRRGYIIGDPDDIIDNAPTVEPCYQTTSCSDCKMYDKENHNISGYPHGIPEGLRPGHAAGLCI